MEHIPAYPDQNHTFTLLRLVRIWYRASRPFTLSAAIVPVLVGSALAFRDGKASLLLLFLILLACLLVQVTANPVNKFGYYPGESY
jgi:1,4-dihydroxy-2-naphthoate octaprenyltransferase